MVFNIGTCYYTTQETVILFGVMAMAWFFIIFGFKNPVMGIFGSIMLLFLSLYVVSCINLFGYVLALFSLSCIIYFAFLRTY